MSFDERFRPRWENVIKPAAEVVPLACGSLEPYRVDSSVVSDAIITEIVSGIASARLVFADITTLERVGSTSFRNGNVLYEVGLAHALRQPQEVLIFRSDRDPLLFDVVGIRVREYDPDANPRMAAQEVSRALSDALAEVELTRHLAVTRAVNGLDAACLHVLLQAAGLGFPHPETITMGQAVANAEALAAIARLLEMEALRTEFHATLGVQQMPATTPDTIPYNTSLTYHLTEFGVHLRMAAVERLGLIQQILALPEPDTVPPEAPDEASKVP